MSRAEHIRRKMMEDGREEQKLALERQHIEEVNNQDNFVRRRKEALDQANKSGGNLRGS